MDYDKLIYEALKKDQLHDLLCGVSPYEIIVSEFTSDVFPTNINAVLVRCIYEKKEEIENIDVLFFTSINKMIKTNATELYIAILYMNACIYQEERGVATFLIDRESISKKIKREIERRKDELMGTIKFDNGNEKKYAWNNIKNFDNYYKKNYGFGII